MTALGATPLLVTADDYGITDATSRAIIDAHHDGVVTAASALVVAPGAADRVAWLTDEAELGVGVHLALVGEDPPLLTAQEVPSLVDRHGRFAQSWRHLLPRLAARRVDPDDVRREFEAQIEVVAAHRAPDHLDCHQHAHLWPSVAEVVVALALRHGVGRVRVPRPTSVGRVDPRGRGLAMLADRLDVQVRSAGLAATERFRGIDEAGSWTCDRLVAAVAELGSGVGSVEINTHPGPVTDAGRGRYAWSYGWGAELDALRSPELRGAVAAAGFELVSTVRASAAP